MMLNGGSTILALNVTVRQGEVKYADSLGLGRKTFKIKTLEIMNSLKGTLSSNVSLLILLVNPPPFLLPAFYSSGNGILTKCLELS